MTFTFVRRERSIERARRLMREALTQGTDHEPYTEVFAGVDRLRRPSGFSEFCASQLRIVDKKMTLTPFRLNLLQRRLLTSFWRLRHARRRSRLLVIILKYRKLGVSTFFQGMNFWETWRNPHAFCATLAHTDKDTRLLFRMASRFHDHQPHGNRHQRSRAQRMEVSYPGWDSIFAAGTAGSRAPFRGGTLTGVHISEVAQVRGMENVHAAVLDTLADNGYLVWESTANGKDGDGEVFYKTWLGAQPPKGSPPGTPGANGFLALFYPWFEDPANIIALDPGEEIALDAEATDLVRRHHLTAEQIKWWTDRRRGYMLTGRSGDLIHQEHPSDPETCFLESGGRFFDSNLLRERGSAIKDPIAVEDNGRLRIYEHPRPGVRYAIGADVGEGTGGDDSAAAGINCTSGEQVFAYNFNGLPPGEFGIKLAEFGWRWKTDDGTPATVGVERQNHGHATLYALRTQARYPVEQTYHDIDMTADAPNPAGKAGWNHDVQGHQVLTDVVGRSIKEGRPIIRDEETLASVKAVRVADNGGAEFSGRDLAVAWGVACVILPTASRASFLFR